MLAEDFTQREGSGVGIDSKYSHQCVTLPRVPP